jgi:Domain of unknown function (DUF4157)
MHTSRSSAHDSRDSQGPAAHAEAARTTAAGKTTASELGASEPSSGGAVLQRKSGEAGGGDSPRMEPWHMTPGLMSAMGLLQRKSGDAAAPSGAGAVEIGEAGVRGAGSALPHGEAIQRSFGRHDVSGIQAHTGGDAAAAAGALGAEAYATGHHVAFAGTPSLHTAAHEAAHVVQQRGGVQLKGGVGAAGDQYEQHADAVADAVVQGRSAEGLLDRYSGGGDGGGGGGGGGIQRKEGDPPGGTVATPAGNAAGGTTTATVDVKPIIDKLDRLPAGAFAGLADGAFSLDVVTTWINQLTAVLTEAKTVAASAGATVPPELTAAVDRAVAAHGPELTRAAEAVRTATVQLTNDSSVSKSDPGKATFPTQDEAKKLAAAATKLNELGRDAAFPGGADAKATLQASTAVAQDAALAVLQSLTVSNARERWKEGTSTETPSVADAGKGDRKEVDDIFQDSGFGNRVTTYAEKEDPTKKHIFDWCGMFVASSYFKGAGMAERLRAGFYHTDNVQDFFFYRDDNAVNATRAPMAIWAENQWWSLKDYHALRGSPRRWTPRDTIKAALVAGGAGDIRPGDTCLIDHGGGNKPSHIVMVESYDPVTKLLVTIEGNTFGIHADADGKAERVDDDHLKASAQGAGTATGLHVRDLNTLAPVEPAPGPYVVTNPDASVRKDDDLTKFKVEGGKTVKIPLDTAVEVTELKVVGGKKYANVKDWGWTSFANLGTSAKAPAGSYSAKAGATIWGVGRPSLVDFEDGHEYSVDQVPASLKTTSPEDIKKLAAKKGKEGADARKVKF